MELNYNEIDDKLDGQLADIELNHNKQIAYFLSYLFIFLSIPFLLIVIHKIPNFLLLLIRAIPLFLGIAAWILLKYGHYKTARFILTLGAPFTVTLLTFIFLPPYEFHQYNYIPKIWIITSLIIPFLLYKYEEWKQITVILLINVILFFAFDRLNQIFNITLIHKDINTKLTKICASFTSIIFISLSLFFVKRQLHLASNEIFKKNTQLIYMLKELSNSEKQILNANNELNSLNEQLNIKQKLLETTLSDLSSSFEYARSIQRAIMLPRLKILEKHVKDYFLLYKPKEQVGGDFYLFEDFNEFIAIAIGDATGHSIPGAMMAMLAISTIDNVLHKKNLKTPAEKLNLAKRIVFNTLNQDITTSKDSFDVALIMYYPLQKIIQYAGANIPLYKYQNGQLIKYKPDKNSVGYWAIEQNFTNHIIHVKENDQFYIFTDGYPDQFGGEPPFKKFGRKKLIQLIEKIANLPMQEQKRILETTIINWMKKFGEQVDDITVFGFKL